jgi:hypothetical protein
MTKREDLLNELLQFLEEPQQERKRVSYPAPFLSIDHKENTWTLVDRNTKEKYPLGKEIEIATTQTFVQTKVFTSAGVLRAMSQIVLPSERRNMLNVITGELWENVEIREDDVVINSWIVPTIIKTDKDYIKAIWEIKRTSLKAMINFLQENNLRNLNALQLKLSLVSRREGVKKWAEPKVLQFKSLKECQDDKLLVVALEFIKAFHEFRKEFNLQAIQSNEDLSEY